MPDTNDIGLIAEIVVCLLLLTGSVFTLVAAIGLLRFPDFFMRLHGPTKSTTLGVGGVVIASVVFFSSKTGQVSLHELLISAFLFLTAPISAHMLAKAAMQQKLPILARTQGRPWSSLGDAGDPAPLEGSQGAGSGHPAIK